MAITPKEIGRPYGEYEEGLARRIEKEIDETLLREYDSRFPTRSVDCTVVMPAPLRKSLINYLEDQYLKAGWNPSTEQDLSSSSSKYIFSFRSSGNISSENPHD